ncbi:hypothetical protein Ahy_A09g045635 [Arachis hypogaea]|uniref:Uncharacterized protein n=1 Tax=Arachis hypogaea TaxID=3818 RepID=A0A445BMT9_ARAHY|nr:hypothetical protein Ahy_A09g045635 [Arachis hypogaea]
MATASHTQAVKFLNKSPGGRRFILSFSSFEIEPAFTLPSELTFIFFKSFSERVDEIDINVYRSLEKVKAEPSEGSSFFRDCLIEWRLKGMDADSDILLTLVLLHKEYLISKLLSRLHLKARLSVEPILRQEAAGVLWNLSFDDKNSEAIAAAGGVQVLS